ncbi:MAG: hypothetical protein B6D39_02445 [Anaerolineae bacterium UTCFX2]|jgi:capsular exopolysaccharide synthesis family protein|nr:polysaccharide biosynthesis tyrosine autokinase [Anaerolineae bacterium]MCZ7551934.1 polysaccharide biosynthesis tyrosine autokinase [Anaerolineales bacterium]OQY93941.1 MAG: hypothetical protein B6D39_02445 [Anaerolineae bacterium UTCFX2]
MEIRQVVEPLLKWWKLILVACLLSAVSSFIVVKQQPPIYQTKSAVVIGRAVYEPNPSGGELGLANQLAAYYADIAEREVVRANTMQALNLTWLPEYTAAVVPNSQIIEISVTDTDPARAQIVANELANQLVLQSPSNPDLQEQKRQEFIAGQLLLLEEQIQQTLDEISTKESELGSLNSAREITQAQTDLSILRQKLTTLQTNYATMLNSSTGRASNSLSILEPAELPVKPIGPNRMMFILVSIVIALLISGAAAYLIEYLDDTIKTPEDVNRVMKKPVIGYIAEIEGDGNKGSFVHDQPASLIAESFRALRVNLEYPHVPASSNMLLVVSMSQTEGKSVIAANLAVSMASGGKRVVLVDADLRRPSLHQYLNLQNERGLIDVLNGSLPLDQAISPTEYENLQVLAAGPLVPNPTDFLNSKKMDQLLGELSRRWDCVLVDGPPILVTDTSVLASKVNSALIVIGYGKTRKSQAVLAVKQLDRIGAEIVGVVLNRIPRSNQKYYKIYHYDYGLPDKTANSGGLSIRRFKIPLSFNLPKPGFLSRAASNGTAQAAKQNPSSESEQINT